MNALCVFWATLCFQRQAGARNVTVVNRTAARPVELAARPGARPGVWLYSVHEETRRFVRSRQKAWQTRHADARMKP
jgi:hypothetical protein